MRRGFDWEERPITKTIGVLTVILTCIGVLAVTSAAGFVVTDPRTLAALGVCLLSTGLGTRRFLRGQKKKG